MDPELTKPKPTGRADTGPSRSTPAKIERRAKGIRRAMDNNALKAGADLSSLTEHLHLPENLDDMIVALKAGGTDAKRRAIQVWQTADPSHYADLISNEWQYISAMLAAVRELISIGTELPAYSPAELVCRAAASEDWATPPLPAANANGYFSAVEVRVDVTERAVAFAGALDQTLVDANDELRAAWKRMKPLLLEVVRDPEDPDDEGLSMGQVGKVFNVNKSSVSRALDAAMQPTKPRKRNAR